MLNKDSYFKWENRNNENILKHLTSNIRHDKSSKIVYFDISTFGTHFLHHRRPFYEPAVIEEYDWPILHILKSIIFKELSQSYSSAPQPQYALTELQGNLNRIIASHPTYGSFKYERTVDKRGKGILLFTLDLFDKKDGLCIATISFVIREFTNERANEIEQMRKDELKQYTKNMKQIEYAQPHFVGYSSQKYVFLSNLKEMSNTLSCNGLCTFDKGFVLHPWIAGSGDHVNSTHVMDIFYQFANLIVRNGNRYKALMNAFQTVKHFDPECNITFYKWDVRFLKHLEVDYQFKVRLNSIRIENAQNKFKVAFAFSMNVSIVQQDCERVSGTVFVCPIFFGSKM